MYARYELFWKGLIHRANIDNHGGNPMSEESMKKRTYHAVNNYFAGQTTKGKLLDAPCGNGILSKKLSDQGFEVVSLDIAPSVVIEKNLNFMESDLNKKLPFKDNSLACIASVEGMEHIENPYHVVREFRRIIREGGLLVVTTPNIQNIGSRFRFMMTGGFNYFKRPYHREYTGHGLYGHINPISFHEMIFILHDNRFRIEKIFTDAPRLGSLMLFFLWPFISLSTLYFICLRERNHDQRKENLRLFKYMSSMSLMFGRIMMIAARAC
jgi:SAM-dependent methyltransferase